MKQSISFSFLYITGFLLFLVFYLSFFKPHFERVPYFYFYDKKIYFAYEEYRHLIFQNILSQEEISDHEILLTTEKGTFTVKKETFYFKKFLEIFYIPFSISFVFFLYSIWFYENFRDFFFASFFLFKSFFITATLLSFYYPWSETYFIFWNIITVLFLFYYFNINIRFLGKSINSTVLLIETLILLFVILILLIKELPRKETFLQNLYFYSFLGIELTFFTINFIRILSFSKEFSERIKILSFVTGNLMIAISLLLFLYVDDINDFLYLFLAITYPLLIAYSLHRIQVLPATVIFTKTFVFGAITLLFVAIYFSTLYVYDLYFPEKFRDNRIFVDILLLFLLIFIIEPAREKFFRYLNKKLLIPEKKYILSLTRLSSILARISRPNLAIELFLKEVRETLNVEKCSFLFPASYIPDIELKKEFVLEVESSEGIWDYVIPEKMIASTNLLYSTGQRKKFFDFLLENKIILLIGLGKKATFLSFIYEKFLTFLNSPYKYFTGKELTGYKKLTEKLVPKTALLLGFPEDRKTFTIQEFRYIQEVCRLATMLLMNIYTLFQEVSKRKKIRFIHQTGNYQRKLVFHYKNFPSGISIHYFNQPVLSVSGDYVDILPVDRDKIAVFLGDVCGHGLGTGYLVSAVHSIVHYALENSKSLRETVNTVNLFLTERYKGYEFLTLFAFILDIPSGVMEFINAAHSGVFVKQPHQPLQKIENVQRILGLYPQEYQSHFYKLKPGTRLFLCSDGVWEAHNSRNEIFGEENFHRFLEQHHHLPLQEISEKLIQELKRFCDNQPFQDDATFLALEYNPQKSIMESIFHVILTPATAKRTQ